MALKLAAPGTCFSKRKETDNLEATLPCLCVCVCFSHFVWFRCSLKTTARCRRAAAASFELRKVQCSSTLQGQIPAKEMAEERVVPQNQAASQWTKTEKRWIQPSCKQPFLHLNAAPSNTEHRPSVVFPPLVCLTFEMWLWPCVVKDYAGATSTKTLSSNRL